MVLFWLYPSQYKIFLAIVLNLEP